MPIFLKIILTLILIILLGSFILSFYFTHRYYLKNPSSPSDVGLTYEDVIFKSTDGLTLGGWWIPARGSDNVVIQLHGHAGSMDPDIQYLPTLHQHGYNVLMFDFRGHGRSQGSTVTIGYLERQDVLGAIDFVKQKGFKKIALLGFSMGGVLAILVGAICPDVKVVISDSAPVHLTTALRERIVELGIPRFAAIAIAWLIVATTSLRLGANLFNYDAACWVGKIAPRPLYLMHGGADRYVPDFDELVRAAGPSAQVWNVPNIGHTQVINAMHEEYLRRLADFLDKNI
jgi:pimeloyl-ACP methyl ester carboxylesterase